MKFDALVAGTQLASSDIEAKALAESTLQTINSLDRHLMADMINDKLSPQRLEHYRHSLSHVHVLYRFHKETLETHLGRHLARLDEPVMAFAKAATFRPRCDFDEDGYDLEELAAGGVQTAGGLPVSPWTDEEESLILAVLAKLKQEQPMYQELRETILRLNEVVAQLPDGNEIRASSTEGIPEGAQPSEAHDEAWQLCDAEEPSAKPSDLNVITIWYGPDESGPAEWLGGQVARILSPPLFVENLFQEDIVQLTTWPDYTDGWPTIDMVLFSRYGERTYILFDTDYDAALLEMALSLLGCSFRRFPKHKDIGRRRMLVAHPKCVCPITLAKGLDIKQDGEKLEDDREDADDPWLRSTGDE